MPSKLPCGYVPVDMDVSPFDNSKTSKEGVSQTYKGCDGYAPMFAYIGREGYLANLELREGKQHCQKGTPQFLDETINICRQLTDEPLLFRLDSGNDSAENIGILLERGCYFIIKRNLRKESKEGWLQMAKDNSKDIAHPRDGKAVYIGSDWKEVIYQAGDGTTKHATIRMGYENVYNRPVIVYTMEIFQNHPEINAIMVACLSGWENMVEAYAKQFEISKLRWVIQGGRSGQETSKLAVDRLMESCSGEDIIVIHDAIRPMVSDEIISDSIHTCRRKGMGVAAVTF